MTRLEQSTVGSHVAERLGTLIVNGADRYIPGCRINMHETGAELETTRTTLGTACFRLVGYGLLDVGRRAGTVVRPISDWHLLDPAVASWLTNGPDRHGLIAQLRQFAELLQERPLTENRFWLAALATVGGPP